MKYTAECLKTHSIDREFSVMFAKVSEVMISVPLFKSVLGNIFSTLTTKNCKF